MSRKAGTISEETKTRLLQAATEEFAEYGYERSSLRRICKNAEVTTGALYFFFQDKEDLFQSVIAPVTEPILQMMESHYEKERACNWEELGDAGRVLIRPSGTEPLIRVMVEGPDLAQIDGIARRIADAIQKNLA